MKDVDRKKQATKLRREMARTGKIKSFFSKKQLRDLKKKGVLPKDPPFNQKAAE